MKTFLYLLLFIEALTLIATIGRFWSGFKRHSSYETWTLTSHVGMILVASMLFVLAVMG